MTELRLTGILVAVAGLMDAAPPGNNVKRDLERQLQTRNVPAKLGRGG